MLSEETIDCYWKIGPVEKRWHSLLLDWINKCVCPKDVARYLSAETLLDIINKYKKDICHDDLDRAMLCTDDIEPFLKYKYPILRLGYYSEDKDLPRKQYVMHLTLLYHCCVNSETGCVDKDICDKLENDEKEAILKFCEYLSDIEVTLSNVETAASHACEMVFLIQNTKKETTQKPTSVTTCDDSYATSSNSIFKQSITTLSCSSTATKESPKKPQNLQFKSPGTVVPSPVETDTWSCSKTSMEVTNTGSDNSNYNVLKNTSQSADDKKTKGAHFSRAGNKINVKSNSRDTKVYAVDRLQENQSSKESGDHGRCRQGCKCVLCKSSGTACGDPDSSYTCYKEFSNTNESFVTTSSKIPYKYLNYFIAVGICILLGAVVMSYSLTPIKNTVQYKQINDVDVAELIKNVDRVHITSRDIRLLSKEMPLGRLML